MSTSARPTPRGAGRNLPSAERPLARIRHALPTRLVTACIAVVMFAGACAPGTPPETSSAAPTPPTVPESLAFAEPTPRPPEDTTAASRLLTAVAPVSEAGNTCTGPKPTPVIDQLREAGSWAAGDLMDVVELGDGRSLWIFGDTFLGAVDEAGAIASDHRFVHSSAALVTDGCAEVVATDDGWAWVSWQPDGTWLWPQGAVVVGDLLHVFLVRVTHDPEAPPGLDFDVVGGAMAVFDLADLSHPLLVLDGTPMVDGRPFGWSPVVVDDMVVVHAQVDGVGTHLARVATEALVDFDEWEYWDGDGWVTAPAQAQPIHPEPLRVRIDGDELIGLSLPFGAHELRQWTATRPEGPWTAVTQHDLGDVVDFDTGWAYQPLALHQDGQLQAAVNVLPWDPTSIHEDVDRYTPRFVDLDGG